MKKRAAEARERLSKVLMQDKSAMADGFTDLIKSDVTELLKNYFDLYSGVEIKVEMNGDVFDVTISAKADGVKRCGRFVSRG